MINCGKCKIGKPEDQFHWANKAAGRRKTICKDCRSTAPPKPWANGYRVCKTCGTKKSVDNFGKRSYPNNGYITECKECTAVARKAKVHAALPVETQKQCTICYDSKSISDFPLNKNSAAGYLNVCKPCYSKKNVYASYKMTVEEFASRLESQGNKCLVCFTVFEGKIKKHVDHDHSCCPGIRTCGKCVRGILCGLCNLGLGAFKDNPAALRAAADYLEKI